MLAEYGPTAVRIAEACRVAKIPFVVHFHGYDASKHRVIDEYREKYEHMFGSAAAIVGVSRAMCEKLHELGAPREKLFWNPYGVDIGQFSGASPSEAPPRFVAVGRFCEKKAPHLTLSAFAQVRAACDKAELRMIGEGQLLKECRDHARELGIADAVHFLGAQPQQVVQRELRNARAFVQHSAQAADGDCEGTPVGVLEASATGLPVVSTRHAGIPDVVVEGETGMLVDEHDVDGMASAMVRLASHPDLAATMGQNGRQHIRNYLTMEDSINRLHRILSGAAAHEIPSPCEVAPKITPRPRTPADPPQA